MKNLNEMLKTLEFELNIQTFGEDYTLHNMIKEDSQKAQT